MYKKVNIRVNEGDFTWFSEIFHSASGGCETAAQEFRELYLDTLDEIKGKLINSILKQVIEAMENVKLSPGIQYILPPRVPDLKDWGLTSFQLAALTVWAYHYWEWSEKSVSEYIKELL